MQKPGNMIEGMPPHEGTIQNWSMNALPLLQRRFPGASWHYWMTDVHYYLHGWKPNDDFRMR